MSLINWEDFQKADLCAGTIIKVEKFPEAKTPACKNLVDLGNEFGGKTSGAQDN